MNYNSIEKLNNIDLMQMYNNIIEGENFKISSCYMNFYFRCSSGRTCTGAVCNSYSQTGYTRYNCWHNMAQNCCGCVEGCGSGSSGVTNITNREYCS